MSWDNLLPWNWGETTKAKLDRKVDQKMFSNLPRDDVRAQVDTTQKERLAAQMAGTADKKSRAYKSARDALTRWATGKRTPKPASLAKVNNAARADRISQYRSRGSLNISVVGDWRTSKTTWKNGNVHTQLTGQKQQDFLDAIERGDNETAVKIVCDHYGLDPDLIENIENITDFDIR
jgi:hypothetical protein